MIGRVTRAYVKTAWMLDVNDTQLVFTKVNYNKIHNCAHETIAHC
jgi:hypothetical protein